jgi:hypothetical protein
MESQCPKKISAEIKDKAYYNVNGINAGQGCGDIVERNLGKQ